MSAERSGSFTVVAADSAAVGGPIDSRRAGNARGQWHERRGLRLTVRTERGGIGLGEASPLPGYSPDTLDTVRRALGRISWAGLRVRSIADIEAVCASIAAPAARFAAETALLELLAGRQSLSVAEVLAAHIDWPVQPWAGLCALIAAPLERDPAHDIAAAWARGIRCIKVKIGRPGRFAEELTALGDIRARYGTDLAIRLDVNRAWTRTQAASNLPALVGLGPEYVEEPCHDWAQLGRSPVPLAADESLIGADAETVEVFLATGLLAALVLKPMVLGGILPCLRLAGRARTLGLLAVPSHLFDGPIAMNAYTHMALVVGGTCGLDRHAGLAAWPERALPHLHSARVERGGRGRSPLDRLSVQRAAEDHGDAPFLICPGGEISYRQMATAATVVTTAADPDERPGRPAVIVAERDPDIISRILTCFATSTPAVLLDPRSPPDERARLSALIDELYPDAGADLVLFTSGSSGRPKGVLIDRAALVASADASARHLGWRADDRWLCCLPLAHIGGLSIIVRCLLAGTCAVLVPEGSFDPRAIAATIAERRVTLLSLVPTMLARLLDIDWSPPAHVRAVLVGGAATPRALLRRAHERGVPALVTYGMTETCSQIATQEPGDGRPELQAAGHIGPLLLGVEVEVRGGRLWVRGPSLCRSYLGGALADWDRFDERGFFDTGDRGSVDDAGHLHIHGRADETIITGGENVDPAEVEQVLCAHPAIAAACVFAISDPTWGQLVAAAVVAVGADPLQLREIGEFLAERLPSHKRPRRICQLSALAPDGQLKVSRRQVAGRARAHLQPLGYGETGE